MEQREEAKLKKFTIPNALDAAQEWVFNTTKLGCLSLIGIIRSQLTTIRLLSADIIKEGDYSYENVIITGYDPINQSIASLFPSNYEQLAHSEYFIYLGKRSDDK